MDLFNVIVGMRTLSDKPRSASHMEISAYLRWIAEKRGVVIPAGAHFCESGIWTKSAHGECVLPMPGYGIQPHVVCEVLDDAGEVVSRMVLPDTGKGKLPMTAKQVQEWSGLKPVRKSARKGPSERVAASPVQPQGPEAVSTPSAAPVVKTGDISETVAQALLARIEALEAALAATGKRPLQVAAPANDDHQPRQVRSATEARAIQRAWDMRKRMRAAHALADVMAERADDEAARAVSAEARASDFERIAVAEATRADEMKAQAENARRAATDYKREGIAAEERALNAHSRASRIVGAAMRYRTTARRAVQDVRASRAEARALTRRLDDARRAIAAHAPPVAPAGNTLAAAFAEALA